LNTTGNLGNPLKMQKKKKKSWINGLKTTDKSHYKHIIDYVFPMNTLMELTIKQEKEELHELTHIHTHGHI
jgi:hypothetical protein